MFLTGCQLKGRTMIFFFFFCCIQKQLKVHFKLSPALSWNAGILEKLHKLSVTVWLLYADGKTVGFFASMAKPFSYQKYSGAIIFRERSPSFLAFSTRIHPEKNLQDQIHYLLKKKIIWGNWSHDKEKRPANKHLIKNFPLVLKFTKPWKTTPWPKPICIWYSKY